MTCRRSYLLKDRFSNSWQIYFECCIPLQMKTVRLFSINYWSSRLIFRGLLIYHSNCRFQELLFYCQCTCDSPLLGTRKRCKIIRKQNLPFRRSSSSNCSHIIEIHVFHFDYIWIDCMRQCFQEWTK